jgi:hypothetical protein
VDPAQKRAKRNIKAEAARRVALGPGSRARAGTVRKIGAEARAWPGHEKVTVTARLFARSARTEARCRIIPIHHVKQRTLLHSRGALLRPGFACLFSIRPMRGGRSAERRNISVVALLGATIRAY